MKRTPLARRTPLAPGGALRRSPLKATRATPRRGRQQADDWTALREAVFRRDGGCRLRRLLPDHRCWGDLHAHHVRRRSQGGGDHVDNLVALCASGHQWVHEHPANAAALGLLTLRGDHDGVTDPG